MNKHRHKTYVGGWKGGNGVECIKCNMKTPSVDGLRYYLLLTIIRANVV